MRCFFRTAVLLTAIVFLLSASALEGRDNKMVKTFEAKDLVRINTVSGDCLVKKGDADKIEVRVSYDVHPEDVYEPEFRERSRSLSLNENIHASCSGSSEWEISVPEGTRIRFSSASGEFLAENLIGEFETSTASGDIELIDCQGEFDLSSASGRIILEKCSGYFEVSTASGTVEALEVNIEHASEFSSASGNVEIVLGGTLVTDLAVSTASGRAVLNYNGHPLTGHFEFVSRVRKGRMDSPIEFEWEETFRRHGEKYVARAFTRGTSEPEILLETASGRVALRED